MIPKFHINITRKRVLNVNHVGFDDAKIILFDDDCHHQKGGECISCRL